MIHVLFIMSSLTKRNLRGRASPAPLNGQCRTGEGVPGTNSCQTNPVGAVAGQQQWNPEKRQDLNDAEDLRRRATMGRYLLLWLLGVPIPILILIWAFGGLH
jgi:hypothetical protein